MPEQLSRAEIALNLFRCLSFDPKLQEPAFKESVVAVLKNMVKAEGGLASLGISAKEWQVVVGSPYQPDLAKPPVILHKIIYG